MVSDYTWRCGTGVFCSVRIIRNCYKIRKEICFGLDLYFLFPADLLLDFMRLDGK